ncbi:epimerase [Anaerosacchariphilus polymeriproducens]|uniref:Epimerase n=1 Tax=Anaerosacchariphilus polymeriproducens TaxID=1812858 RepID=A0A371AVI8_9FIRM|nr:epimerase [Anaerosacchariphilus polymeriproducens]RDU23586.1 epimerase [Anaerosacchariphilus polymeriproducens]
MSENILDYFGNKLMKEVRDETISSLDMMIDGKMKGSTAQQIRGKISTFNEEQLMTIKWLITKITDLSIHNLLMMIEQNDDIKVMVDDNDIKEDSDGLEGELYTEDGWISRFSKERYEEI